MSQFIDSEAEESEEEEELTDFEKKKLKKLRTKVVDSDEEEEDDEDKIREELGDLIDDNPIEEDESDSGSEEKGAKRKRDDDDDELDDRLSDDDFDLIEENLGIKVKRKKQFTRVKRIEDDESDDELHEGQERDAIANVLFEGSDGEDDNRSRQDKVRSQLSRNEEDIEEERYSEEEEEYEEDIDDFIVDADGRPIHGKKKKRKAIYTDAALQEAQDIFGVDFDYDDFQQEGDLYEEDEEGHKATADGKPQKKRSQRKTIYDVYEPSELERGHFTDYDEQVRKNDMPERMQLRHVPISAVEEGSKELDLESEWIYKHAFSKASISKQERSADGRDKVAKGPMMVEKIRKALEFMRNELLEVPFIAFYRKEYVQPDLTINDLWRVYKFDEKWTQLQSRKKNMMRLFNKMLEYQSEKLTKNVEESIPENVRVLKDEDIYRLGNVQSLEELNDVYAHFNLYYGTDVPVMQEAHRLKQKEEARERRREAARRRQADGGEDLEDIPEEEALDEESTIKQTKRNDQYTLCSKAGLDGLIHKYGLSPEQFAENLRDNYQRHAVEQYPTKPHELALDYVSPKFSTAEEVLKAANYMLAVQMAREPLVRQCVRDAFHERTRINVVPTKQGLKEVDENHALFGLKFLKDKPVRDLQDDQFLRLSVAEQDKLLTITFQTGIEGSTTGSYSDEIKQLFAVDEFSQLVQDWNDLRNQVVDIALNKIIFPTLIKELKTKLESESREFVLKACGHQLYNWLKVSPYSTDFPDEEEDEWDTKNGLRVMAISYTSDADEASFGCLVNVDGECSDHIRLENILKRKNAFRDIDRAGKEKDMGLLRNFIMNKKPHVIVVSGESREAIMVVEDVREIVQNLVNDEQFPSINVELTDNSLAKVFANSTRGETEFREYPQLLREAVSLARRIQDPLIEYAQLCNNDEEIMCLKYHPLQDQLAKEELLETLYLEFVNRTNEVGVDINRAINFPHTATLLQFVCGLGPRKAQALIKTLKQNNQRLENRTQLVTVCHMGPKVFVNCSGFIKIDTNSLGDSTETYVEVLDGSRIHPETYEWARKMAVDALEYDDEDANPAGAVEEILETPERLKDLDLDAFAVELERQGLGNKSITLYDIRSELNHRYKDVRSSYVSPTPEEIFNMVTKETPQTFFIGKLVMATVTGFQHRKPKPEELDRASPVRNEETGLWQCPFCFKNDFPDLSEVWNHFDAGACTGQAVGVRIRLDNSLSGFIPMKCLSDSEVSNPEERVRPGQAIHCRVTKIDVERFSVMSTSKSSDLMDKNGEWRPQKDPYYDTLAEEDLRRAEVDSKKQKQRQSYTTRVIVHPSFKNISFKEAEKLMATMDQGDVIVRPSSKGTDHLTVTWKVGESICQHVDVREEGKENAFSLGQSLWISHEEFEDLDEIIARYINPMAGHAKDIYGFRYFRDLGITDENYAPGKERERADEIIKDEKKKNPGKINYFASASREYPGKFMLTYLPRNHAKHEFITVAPEGFRFRGQMFTTLALVFGWFKKHFRDPIPGTPVSSRGGNQTSGSMSTRTPGYAGGATTPNVGSLSGVNSETLQRVAQSIPSHMLHSLTQAAHFQGTPGAFGYPANTPYTPSGQTPFMTPYNNTPHQPQTPRYSTPASSNPATSGGVFRTPATPSASRGFGSQPQASGYGRQSSGSRSGGYGQSRGADSWSSQTTPTGKTTPLSAAELEWQTAADAWASTTTGSKSGEGRSNSRARGSQASETADAWASSAADDWASSGSSNPAPRSSSSAADAWASSPRATDSRSSSVGGRSGEGRPHSRQRSGSRASDSADAWASSSSHGSQRNGANSKGHQRTKETPKDSWESSPEKSGANPAEEWRQAADAWVSAKTNSGGSSSRKGEEKSSGSRSRAPASEWDTLPDPWASSTSSSDAAKTGAGSRSKTEPADWQSSADQWASSTSSTSGSWATPAPVTPRSGADGRTTPRAGGGNSRFDDNRSSAGRITPGHRSSSRSTTRSNNSPQPMELGDATPLYDE